MQHAPGAFDVLGVRVDVAQITDVIYHMRHWIDAKGPCRRRTVLMGPRFVVRSMAQVLKESASKRGQ